MKDWYDISVETKTTTYKEISQKIGLEANAVEKDWWVVQTLRVIFEMDCANSLVFKGGTSLSKAWGLINRFSEDIDLALDRKYLGFGETITVSQVRKLREASYKYISTVFYPQLKEKFEQVGFKDVTIQLAELKTKDQDPLIIEIYYPSFTASSVYVQPKILVEIGSRSLREPFTQRAFCSLVGEHYKELFFADKNITIPTVNPERTFLEKIFLLHEEF